MTNVCVGYNIGVYIYMRFDFLNNTEKPCFEHTVKPIMTDGNEHKLFTMQIK
jgi:hypothetical protein